MLEKFLVLNPDGSMRWIQTERSSLVASFKAAIGCDVLENVRLPHGFCCVVDEMGKVKRNPQPFNIFASYLYPGTPHGDPIIGPVVFCRIDLVDGEPDWVELCPADLRLLEIETGLKIPDVGKTSSAKVCTVNADDCPFNMDGICTGHISNPVLRGYSAVFVPEGVICPVNERYV